MNSPLAKLVSWQKETGQLDGWTSYHIAAGAFLCKIFQWLGWTSFWCVMGVLIVGVLWEVFEYYIENWRPYGSKKNGLTIQSQILLLKPQWRGGW